MSAIHIGIKNLTAILLLLAGTTSSQNETAKWYFGNQAGLDFMTNPPTILTNGAMNVPGGSSSISNAAGNLLFYTDGVTVWNQAHVAMANGTGLNSTNGTNQNVLIVKQPGNANIYFVFTKGTNNQTLSYSTVDMSLAAGMGSVTAKNTLVTNSLVALVGAVRHCNGNDVWVVVHPYQSVSFYAYLLTAGGLNLVPVVSNGPNFCCIHSYIKISQNGRKIGAMDNSQMFLLDFDPATGMVSNPITLPQFGLQACEFSADGTKFYSNSSNVVYQWNLCAGSNQAILASQYTVTTGLTGLALGMQLAKNGRIYISPNNSSSLHVINNPNVQGAGCNFVQNGQSVAPGVCRQGLVNFVSGSMVQAPPSPPFTHTVSNAFGCQTASFTAPPVVSNFTTVSCASTFSLTSHLWNFGDPTSGPSNTSTAVNPLHAYSALGTYTVQLILRYSCGGGTDTIRQVVNINQPCIVVNSTSITCASLGSATVSSAGGVGPFSYTWMPTGQTNSVATGLSPGTYTLTVFDFGNNFTYTATTVFTSLIPLTGTLFNTGSITCNGANTGTATLSNLAGGSGNQNYLWTNGISSYTTPVTNSLTAGIWSVTVTDALTGCQVFSVFTITEPPALTLSIAPGSPTACAGQSVAFSWSISGGTPVYNYAWTAGPSGVHNPTLSYPVSHSVAGTYIYTLTTSDSYSCVTTETTSIDYISNPVLNLPNTFICPFETGTLIVSGATSYTWSDNSTGNTFTASPAASTQYNVTGEANGCTSIAYAFIVVKPPPFPAFSSNSPVCENQNISVDVTSAASYLWTGPAGFSSFQKNPQINPAGLTNSGAYNVTVTAANGCTASTAGTVTVNPVPQFNILPVQSAICVNLQTVSLVANGTATLYNWSPAQGLSSTTGASVDANPPVTTTYTLTGTLNSCTNIATAQVNVVPPPSLTINLSSPSLCAQAFNGSPNTITLTSSGASQYTLLTSSPILNPDPTNTSVPIGTNPPYYPTGISTATLLGSNGVCTVSMTTSFSIIPNPTVGINTFSPVICAGETFTYTAFGAQTYTWSSATPGSTLFTSGNIAVADPTVNSVFSVMGASLGCFSPIQTSTITVHPLPVLTLLPKSPSVCAGETIEVNADGADSYYWSGTNGYTGVNAHASFSAQAVAGTITLTVIGTAVTSCSAMATMSILIWDLPVASMSVEPENRICLNEELTFKGFGGKIYEWNGPNDFFQAGQTIDFHANSIAHSGFYTLTAIDENKCRGYATQEIIVDNLPQGVLTGRKEGCAPFCGDFGFAAVPSDGGNILVSWSGRWLREPQPPSQPLSQPPSHNFKHCFSDSGVYIVTGKFTDTVTSCVNSQTFSINVYEKPMADFLWLPEKPVEGLENVIFTNETKGEGQSNWSWHFINEKTEGETASYFFREAGDYPVAMVVENRWGCADTSVKYITIGTEFYIYIPNAFTPNDDYINDVFIPVMRGVRKYQLDIFDRWGERIFSTEEQTAAWDGTFRSEACKQDVYVWKVWVATNDGREVVKNGEVLLYR